MICTKFFSLCCVHHVAPYWFLLEANDVFYCSLILFVQFVGVDEHSGYLLGIGVQSGSDHSLLVSDVYIDLESSIIKLLGNIGNILLSVFVSRGWYSASLVHVWLECVIFFIPSVLVFVMRYISSVIFVLVGTLKVKIVPFVIILLF